MDKLPANRCGYTWPEDYTVGENLEFSSCCFREALPDTDRCAWHAAEDETDHKTIENLQAVRAPVNIREKNTTTLREGHPDITDSPTSYDEILDGAILAEMDLKDKIPLKNVRLAGSELTGADLEEAELTNVCLSEGDLTGTQLSCADLTHADLSKADLTGADLSDTDLVRSEMKKANLTNADLTHANLNGSYLRYTKLTNTIFNRTKLTNVNLRGNSLTESHLKFLNLNSANLHKTDLSGVDLGLCSLKEANLSMAKLTGANLGDVGLAEADLSHADLTNADLTMAELPGANLSEADLTGVNLEQANLNDADLEGAVLNNANLSSASLSGSDFSRATLRGAELPSEDDALKEVKFIQTDLQEQDLRFKNLSDVRLRKANLTDTDLSNANLSEANLERALLNRADLFDTRLSGAHLEGAVFGNVQANEGMFEKLAPSNIPEGGCGLSEKIKRLFIGPNGDDNYRCVYDPASYFNIPKKKTNPDGSDKSNSNSYRSNDRTDCDDNSETNNINKIEHKTEAEGQSKDDPEVRAGGVYRQFERLAADNALPSWQQKFFMLRQDMQIRQKYGIKYAFAVLQRTLFGFGESFSRVVGWSSAIVLVFSVFYLVGGFIRPVESGGELGPPVVWTRLPEDVSVLWESFYYSTLTFTALGFGDFRPVGSMGQLLTVVETAIGALLFALIVFVLGRRAAR